MYAGRPSLLRLLLGHRLWALLVGEACVAGATVSSLPAPNLPPGEVAAWPTCAAGVGKAAARSGGGMCLSCRQERWRHVA
jgi:hypothetical protein